MLNFLKKLFLSNKYSLLVLLILALWLKLVKDYNILLSYLVLIVLYLFVGIIVEMVLERFFPGFNAPRHAELRDERGAGPYSCRSAPYHGGGRADQQKADLR